MQPTGLLDESIMIFSEWNCLDAFDRFQSKTKQITKCKSVSQRHHDCNFQLPVSISNPCGYNNSIHICLIPIIDWFLFSFIFLDLRGKKVSQYEILARFFLGGGVTFDGLLTRSWTVYFLFLMFSGLFGQCLAEIFDGILLPYLMSFDWNSQNYF